MPPRGTTAKERTNQMTAKEARQLLVNGVVMWDNNPNDLGTVRKLSPTAFYVDWENGKKGWIDFYDAQKISIR